MVEPAAGRTVPSERPAAGALAAVVLDMDGVVVDSEPLSFATMAEVLAAASGSEPHAGTGLAPAELRELAGVATDRALAELARRAGLRAAPAALYREYEARYLPRLREYAVPTPGLEVLLAGLQAAAVPVGLASSSTLSEVNAVLGALRLQGRLAAVASGQEVARPKPAPDVYRLVLERLGVGPAGVVAIEDSATGVAAAATAGVGCVAVRTAFTEGHDLGRAALVVGSLEELDVELLARIAAR